MNRARTRTHLPALVLSSLALAFAGFLPRAEAQEDDDDKLPLPVMHHVIRALDAKAADDDAKVEKKPLAEPERSPPPPPRVEPPEESPAATKAAPAAAQKAPPAASHHKETKREKKERLRREKLDKHRRPPRPAEPPTAEHREAAPEPPAATHEAGEGEARRPAGGDMDFDFIPQKARTSEESASIEGKIKTRRTMLQLHQGFGIATAALMAATVVTGQLNYSDRFGGGGSNGQYEVWHGAFEAATTVSFATAGLLAILAPTPFEHKSDGVDTVTVHKWTMLVATIGMGAEVPLGIWTVTREGYVNQGTLALTHLIVGYVTAAALTVGATALFF